MKILLIQPPTEGRPPSIFPIGLGYIARALLDVGHDVEVLDIWAHQYSKKEVSDRLKKLKYDTVGINAFCTQYNYIKWLARELKNHNFAPIIIGGALALFNSEILSRKFANAH